MRHESSSPSHLLATRWPAKAWAAGAALLATITLAAGVAAAAPKVVVISLDGATPRLVDEQLTSGVLSPTRGLGLLQSVGIRADWNVTVSPSLTAPGHIAIATGSSAARNDVVANTFHLVASPFATTVSGFAAPIGGYSIGPPPSESPEVTAEPLWIALRAAGKSVVAATFPGADGIDAVIPGVGVVVQPSRERTVDYTVPFGAFAGVGAQGFALMTTDFAAAPSLTMDQLAAAGRTSFSPVLQKVSDLESFTVGGVTYRIQVAALDTTDDATVNYDTLVFWNQADGIRPGPFDLPSTGPAYVRAADGRSGPFYLENSSSKAGVGFFVSALAPDLSTVRIARYGANAIPRNAAVIADVDDINTHVGFWAPQADFRIPERLSPGFGAFPDLELEAVYADQVRTFVDYQTRVALRAIERNPDADLVMVYIEQPDGSEHQFLLRDSRQPTDPTNPSSIGAGQDPAKVARYRSYVAAAYRVADQAVQRVIDAVGVDASGRPLSNVIVVSDHGFETFHTAVNMSAFLTSRGFDPAKVRAITSGPAANVYISLQGREPNGTVTRVEYAALQTQLVAALQAFADTNANYTAGAASVPVFGKIASRPLPADMADPSFGRDTSDLIGQDSGDVYALLAPGYNFDGAQSPVVRRLGDPATGTAILSVPNFYGAHGYDPDLPNLSAIFFAAGPNIRSGRLSLVRNIDVAPTVARLLGVDPSPLAEGRPLPIRTGGASLYLRGSGTAASPTLFLDDAAPTSAAAKAKGGAGIRFAGGNPLAEIGTWQAAPFEAGDLNAIASISSVRAWLGLKNSDDQGTKVDVVARVYKNDALIAEGVLRCVAGLTRDPGRAREVVVVPALQAPQTFGENDRLAVKLLTRVGTNPDGTMCAGGHAGAVGLYAYYDAASRPARIDLVLEDR